MNALLKMIGSGVAGGPYGDSDLPYDLFDSGGNLISRGKNAVDVLNPGGAGTKMVMAQQAMANGAMLNEEQQQMLGQKMMRGIMR